MVILSFKRNKNNNMVKLMIFDEVDFLLKLTNFKGENADIYTITKERKTWMVGEVSWRIEEESRLKH